MLIGNSAYPSDLATLAHLPYRGGVDSFRHLTKFSTFIFQLLLIRPYGQYITFSYSIVGGDAHIGPQIKMRLPFRGSLIF